MKKFNFKVKTNTCPFCGTPFMYNPDSKKVLCPGCFEKGHTVEFSYNEDPQEAFDYVNTRNGENELLEKIEEMYQYVKQLGIEGEELDLTKTTEDKLPENGWIITEEATPIPCEVPHDELYIDLIGDAELDVTDRYAICDYLKCINITYLLKIMDIYLPVRYNAKQKDMLIKICSKYPAETKFELEYSDKEGVKQFKSFETLNDFILFLDDI